jgi:hypothetical protein
MRNLVVVNLLICRLLDDEFYQLLQCDIAEPVVPSESLVSLSRSSTLAWSSNLWSRRVNCWISMWERDALDPVTPSADGCKQGLNLTVPAQERMGNSPG